jgi:hypothetical protein
MNTETKHNTFTKNAVLSDEMLPAAFRPESSEFEVLWQVS